MIVSLALAVLVLSYLLVTWLADLWDALLSRYGR